MYPSRFRYEAPRSIAEAIGLLHDGGGEAKVLAGGQSLVPLMKLRFASPELLVDINNLPGLDYHRTDPDGTLRIGALCRHADLERSALLVEQPADHGRGGAADRRPDRAQPGHAGRLAVPRRPAGRLGRRWSPHSTVTSSRKGRTAGAPSRSRDFVTGPFENVLASDEIAVEAVIPAPQGTRAGGYLKLERRVGDFATAGAAVAVETSGGLVTQAGIALTGVGGSTIDATDAAAALIGRPLSADRSAGPPTSPPRRLGRGRTTGAARTTSGTSCTRS